MKKTDKQKKLDELLRSSKIVAGGFLGQDRRSVEEIIEADAAILAGLDVTAAELAEKMRSISDAAIVGLGTWVAIDENRRAMVLDTRGELTCPWPHPGRYGKAATVVERIDTGNSVRWSELSIHMIAEHGFFQGVGSVFRIEPKVLIEVIL